MKLVNITGNVRTYMAVFFTGQHFACDRYISTQESPKVRGGCQVGRDITALCRKGNSAIMHTSSLLIVASYNGLKGMRGGQSSYLHPWVLYIL